MIKAVEVVNFKNFRRQRVELGRLTVFVGANGSGKTSVLNAIDLAVRAARPVTREVGEGGDRTVTRESRPARVFRDHRHCDWLYCRGGVGKMEVKCEMSGDRRFEVSATPPEGWPPSVEQFGRTRWTFEIQPEIGPILEGILPPWRSLVFLHLNPAVLSQPSYSSLTPPRVGQDGKGLATVLAFMALNDPDTFAQFVAEMRVLIPRLKRIRFTRAPVKRTEREFLTIGRSSVQRDLHREFQGDAILFDYDNASDVSAASVSEGTLLLLGLLAVLMGPDKPRILLVDDLEHGLHPLVQQQLLELLRRIMMRFPDLQVIATAHSPYLLDGLHPDEVRLTTTGADGYSICGRLTEHPQFEKWKDEMAPGELWSLFGEKWLAQVGAQS